MIKKYYFINKFDTNIIDKQNNQTIIIYRKYSTKTKDQSLILKIKTVKKPARPAQKNVPNPFQPGTTMDVAAKPASVQVKALALKKLKDMAK